MKAKITSFLHRFVSKSSIQQFMFDQENRSLPEANKWYLSEFVIKKIYPITGIHPYPLDEVLLIGSSISYFKPDGIIEWGTHEGKSARIFWEYVRFLNLNCEIHSVDLPATNPHNENISEEYLRARYIKQFPVILHEGDGLTVGLEIVKSKMFKRPLFFLDGDHSYANISRELTAIKKSVDSCIILIHDTFNQGKESNYNCGPYIAFQEFVVQNNLPHYSTILGLPGMSLTYW
ncbi:MAG: hypothetical protein C0412_22110 [Flavobacterium sp.]|nr:hypothetical protein [Flavobacterium sp.]